MPNSRRDRVPVTESHSVNFKKKLSRFFVHLFAWIGMALLYYAAFSFFFDTPSESRLRDETQNLNREYIALSNRYDTLSMVLDNIAERDNSVFGVLFESTPYSLGDDFSVTKWDTYETLVPKTNQELGDMMAEKTRSLKDRVDRLNSVADQLHSQLLNAGSEIDYIPSIQPVINNDLTALTASYGMRMQPFYKTLTAHQGIDYSVAEGSRVFATADGVVKSVATNTSTSGITVVINHNDMYETTYSHLSKANVRRGAKVKRGDIIAQSGNTGLSIAPHLHYEIKLNGMRVDPIHYFFMELTPNEYQKIIKIASSGMQSLD